MQGHLKLQGRQSLGWDVTHSWPWQSVANTQPEAAVLQCALSQAQPFPASVSLPGLKTLGSYLEYGSIRGPLTPGTDSVPETIILTRVRISAWNGAWHLVGAQRNVLNE